MVFFLFDEKTEPSDIFAAIPSENTPASSPGAPSGGAPASSAPPVVAHAPAFGKKGLVILLVGLLAVAGGLTAFFFWRVSSVATPVSPSEGLLPLITPPTTEAEPSPPTEPEPPQPQPETDTDGDGLTDAREAALGTNVNAVDTDVDGLSDREEADVYLTNPLNPDTDGDTYKDGEEVRNGYDPKGPGKLLQLPTTNP